jgi:ATPase family associated with various cellular activities (AAA)
MPGRTNDIALIQLQPDLLAATLAAAIRRAGDLSLMEPAPAGPEMLNTLVTDPAIEPVVVVVGQPPSLEAQAEALVAARPDLVVLTVPIGEARLGVSIPGPALDDFIKLLRSLVSGGPEIRMGIVEPMRRIFLPNSRGPKVTVTATSEGGPGPISQAWLDAVLRLAIARAGAPDDASLPGLTISVSAAQRMLSRKTQADEADLAALEGDRDRAEAHLVNTLTTRNGEQRLGHLVRKLGLQTVEWQVLLLLLAPELDPLYQRVYGLLHDDLGRRSASLGLIGTVLGSPDELGSQHRRVLAASGGLARWWLTQPRLSPAVSAVDPLQVDPAIRAWLIEGEVAERSDPCLEGWIREAPWPGAEAVRELPETTRIAEVLQRDTGWAVLTGGSGDDWRAVIESASRRASRRLLRITPQRGTPLDMQRTEEVAARIKRAAWLFDVVPAVAPDADADPTTVAALVGHLAESDLPIPAVLLAEDGPAPSLLTGEASVVLPFTPMTMDARAALFQAEAARAGIALGDDTAAHLASSSRLPASKIATAMSLARAKAAGKPGRELDREVAAASRQIAMPHLPRHARLLMPIFDLSQVVLPPDRHAQLHEIIAQCRHAGTVLDRWGFGAQLPFGRAVAALFSGPSGTGKTMAAQAIARALDTDLYMVDLAQVVSKYIGETEKNLDAIFDEAERAGVALLFDEADALFAKRGEVRDAHDRYANIEVAFLLQRLESFSGLAVLTTNFRQNIDTAFLRRIRFAIEFPRPDATAREAIWRQCLPASAPLASDVDLGLLARRIELTGGSIRQVTLRAAFAAAADGPIAMQHLIAAVRAELVKIGMPSAASALWSQRVNGDAA